MEGGLGLVHKGVFMDEDGDPSFRERILSRPFRGVGCSCEQSLEGVRLELCCVEVFALVFLLLVLLFLSLKIFFPN